MSAARHEDDASGPASVVGPVEVDDKLAFQHVERLVLATAVKRRHLAALRGLLEQDERAIGLLAGRLDHEQVVVEPERLAPLEQRTRMACQSRRPTGTLAPSGRRCAARRQEAERWANDTLQMVARRIVLPAMARDPAGFSRSTGDGRLGYLLYRRALTRRVIIPRIRGVFAASSRAERELLAELPVTLDRIDAWIASGILGGAQLNAADFMVVPSLALILYRSDLLPLFEGRPTLELVDRLLPEPA